MIIAALPPDPVAIFLHARTAITAALYPTRIDYTISVSGVAGTALRVNHYRASYRTHHAARRRGRTLRRLNRTPIA